MIEIEVGSNLFEGAATLSWHGMFSFIAVATAVVLVGRWAVLRGIDPDDIYAIAVWAIIGGVIGARLVHVVDNWTDLYSQRPSQIIAIWNGGIGLWGGIIGGFIGGSLYSLRFGHPIGVIADLTAPALLFVQSIGRLGDIVNGEHCTRAANYFLGFEWLSPDATARAACPNHYPGIGSADYGGAPLFAMQPVILFEIVWNIAALVLIWKLRGKLKPDGMLFALYLALYALGRFGIQFLRTDDVWALGMQEAHYIALLVLIATVPLLIAKARFGPTPALEAASAPVPRGSRAERRRRQRRNKC